MITTWHDPQVKRMFLRILSKSFINRKASIAIALVAVIVGAAVPAAMLTVSMDVEENVNREFRKFGANLLIVPKSDTIEVGIGGMNFGSVTEQKYINESDLYKIKTISWSDNILGYAPSLYQVVNVQSGSEQQSVVLVGTWFEKETVLQGGKIFKTGVRTINPWWSIEGNWVEDVQPDLTKSGEGQDEENTGTGENGTGNDNVKGSMIGISVATKLGLDVGDNFTIAYRERVDDEGNEKQANLSVTAIINAGGDVDNSIYVDMGFAQTLTNRPDKVHTVQVSALCIACPVDTFASEIEKEMPYVEAKTVKQLASAEMSVLEKIEDMMFLVTVVALFATAMGVSTTMTTSVISRQKEIGLMKSIGAENKRIASLFFSESAIIGMIGGVVGYLVGMILAQFVGLRVFDSSISPHYIVLPIVLIISVSVVLLASAIPVKRAISIEPIIVLRGD